MLTDRALAVINALQYVFPDTKHLLCFWHVNQAVQAYCHLGFKSDKEWELFYNDWLALVDALMPDNFDTAWEAFKSKWNEKYWQYIDLLGGMNMYDQHAMSAVDSSLVNYCYFCNRYTM